MKLENLDTAVRLRDRLVHCSTLLKRLQQHRHMLEVVSITVEGHEPEEERTVLIPLTSLVRILRDDISDISGALLDLHVIGGHDLARQLAQDDAPVAQAEESRYQLPDIPVDAPPLQLTDDGNAFATVQPVPTDDDIPF